MNMKKKLGPLPVWAWGLIFGVAAYILYERSKSSSASSSATAPNPTASVLDPNAVDPATGLTYGQELSAQYPGVQGNLGSNGGTTTSVAADANPPVAASPATSDTSTAGSLDSLDSGVQAFGQVATDIGQIATALGYQPPPSTTSASNAVSSAKASPPNTSASVHNLVAKAVGHSTAYVGPGTYVGQPGSKVPFNPIKAGLKAVGHSPAYNGPGKYVKYTPNAKAA